MTTNRLAKSAGTGSNVRQCPSDMPRGDSPEQKAARQRFWIDRGNQHLVETGQTHLHWLCDGTHYWLEERSETFRRMEYERQQRLAAQEREMDR